MYSFLWDEYADWYIEISKKRISSDDKLAQVRARRTLIYVLDLCLRVLHPFMPFLTEELWQRLPHKGESLMMATWPLLDNQLLPTDEAAEGEFGSLQALVRSIRNARAEYRVDLGKLIAATVVGPTESIETLKAEAVAIGSLARVSLDQLEFSAANKEISDSGVVRLIVNDMIDAYLPLSDMVDVEKERARLGKQQVTVCTTAHHLGGGIYTDSLKRDIQVKERSDKPPCSTIFKT